MANVTTSRGASMDPEEVRRVVQQAQNDPTVFQQLMNFVGLGGGTASQGTAITGDVGMNPMVTGSVGANAPAGTGGVRLTGDVANAPAGLGRGTLTGDVGGGAATRGGVPITGAGGGSGGGGGRPPVTGSAAPAPSPGPGPGGGPGITLAGMRNQARTSNFGQNIMQQTGRTSLRGAALGLAGRYSPLIGGGLALMQGDPLGAVGNVAGGLIGGIFGPVGAIAGSALGGTLAKGLAGGAAKAVEAVTGQKREEGKSGLLGGGVPNLSTKDMEVAELLRRGGVKTAEEMLPLYQQYRGVDLQNQMQLNQQLGQLTGALNRQMYTAQLAGGAQSQAGQTVRDILASSNPYAASVFRAG